MPFLQLQDAPLKHNLNGGSVIRTLTWITCGPFLTDFIPSKMKELPFKMVHRYYQFNLFLSRFVENISPLCSLCNTDGEYIVHLFCHCPFSKSFWTEVTVFICICCKEIIEMTESLSSGHILLLKTAILNMLYYCCFLGKFHLHKARTIHCEPNFRMFSSDVKSIFTSFKNVSKPLNSKASKTLNILQSVVRLSVN